MRVSAGAQVYSRPTGFRKQCSVLPHNPNHLSLVSNQQWLPWHPGLYAHRPAEHRCARSAIVAAPPRTSKEHGAKTKDCGFFLHVFFYQIEEHTSELQSRLHLVCRLLLEKKKN